MTIRRWSAGSAAIASARITLRSRSWAARLGDGFIGAGTTPGEVEPLLAKLTSLRREYGREQRPFEAMLGITAEPDLDLFRQLQEKGLESTVAPPFQYALGKQHSSLDEKKRQMENFAETILRHF